MAGRLSPAGNGSAGRATLVVRLRGALADLDVPLLVMHGSRARGDARASSDLDLLVWSQDQRPLALGEIAAAAQRASGLEAQAMDGRRALVSAPATVRAALEEGLPIVDRDGSWARLRQLRPEIVAAARADTEARRARLRQVLGAIGAGEASALLAPEPDAIARKVWWALDDLGRAYAELQSAAGAEPQAVRHVAAALDALAVLACRRGDPERVLDPDAAWSWATVRGARAPAETGRACAAARSGRPVDAQALLEGAGRCVDAWLPLWVAYPGL